MPTKAQYQYVIVRGDLSPGLQAAQVAHAAMDFSIEFPDIARKWKQESNYICILQVPDEASLHKLVVLAMSNGYKHSLFYDPDVPPNVPGTSRTGSHTALAVEPGEFFRHLSSLPLALRDRVDKEVAA